MKNFIITVDTEGDNLWNYEKGQEIKTENTLYIHRFQELSEKYGFKPVWLTNYEMASDQRYVDYIKPKMEAGLCEIGIHIHAWNNPPLYNLQTKYSGNPYLIEYPDNVMKAKFGVTYKLIKEKFGIEVKTHRAGRWIMDNRYFSMLEEYGILVDCSYTPTISWTKTPGETVEGGCDYTNAVKYAHMINKVYEIPMTIRKTRNIKFVNFSNIKSCIKNLLLGKSIWLRPAINSLEEMKWLSRKTFMESETDYLMFMMHSSEMMPNGSPYFKNEDDIDKLYDDIEELFKYVSMLGYKGVTIHDYYCLMQNV